MKAIGKPSPMIRSICTSVLRLEAVKVTYLSGGRGKGDWGGGGEVCVHTCSVSTMTVLLSMKEKKKIKNRDDC